MLVWHATDPVSAIKILEEGFAPSWGDAGLGVYFYSDFLEVENYVARGGWDGDLDPRTAVILQVDCGVFDVENILPEHDWPDPETYEHMVMRCMDEGEPNWFPDIIALHSIVPHPLV